MPGNGNCWAVLGFGGNGMANAEIAAELVSAALTGRADKAGDLYATL